MSWTFRHRRPGLPARTTLLLLAAATTFLMLQLAGCSDDPDVILGPGDEEEAEAFAWLWAYDADDDSLRVYDAESGDLKAVFHALPHATIHEVGAGPAEEPTVWMGSGGTGWGFTAGFHMHGDHAHMEIPESLGTVATGPGNTHLSADPHGDRVAWANDGDATFTLVDTATLGVTTLDHGSGHSSALVAHGTLLATHMNEKWARLIDVASNTVTAEAAIDTLAHGDALHHDSETAFISCLNGIEVLDLEDGSLGTRLAYPGAGRCNVLLHGGENPVALGPVRLPSGNSDQVFLLDMAARQVRAVTIAGAALPWNRGAGQIALSGDGTLAALADLASARVHVVDLASSAANPVTTLVVDAVDMACALDHTGAHLWLLDRDSGQAHVFHRHEGAFEEEGHLDLHPGTDWIFITSLDDAIEVVRDY
ncbi:MAG: hypothetical protein IPK64_15690 [bacterium]|nr:hypothetical protein [bacterium]